MKNTKKGLSGILAVLMLVSMLACFVLPVTAEDTQTNYYVGSASEWNTLAAEINASTDGWAGKTIHIQNDISFSTKKTYNDTVYTLCTIPKQIDNFAGTLHGYGYKFSGINITTEATIDLTNLLGTIYETKNEQTGTALIGTLTGTIQDLTLDSSCTFDAGSTTSFGAFALTVNGGTIQECASYATCTTEEDSAALGGFVGTATGAATIDGCIFGGKVISNGTSSDVGVFIGSPESENTIYHSVADLRPDANGVEKLIADGYGSDGAYFGDESSNTASYAVVGENGAYYNDEVIKTDLNEAVWTINDQREQTENDGIYLNVDENGIPCFGNEYNRTVRVRTENGTANPEYAYYAPREIEDGHVCQTRYAPESITGKVWEVSGAERRGSYVYIGHEKDVIVTYHDTILASNVTGGKYYTEYKINQTKAQLQAMVDAYKAMDSAYFNGFAFEVSKNTWITKAENALNTTVTFDEIVPADSTSPTDDEKAEEKARIAEITALEALMQEIMEEEQTLETYAIATTDPEKYPSVKDYDTYKYIDSFKDYKVESAEAWMKAVELSNFAENANATNFSGITLHLTKNIDMSVYPEDYTGSTRMLPLCYSGFFDGNLDGHDYAFENIKIEIDSPYGPVGLIGALGETEARKVQNVGIESGSIKVTGRPRYKNALNLAVKTNIVGGFVGKNYVANSLIRKCRNNADISVENGEYIAGILGEGRTYAIIDSCINEGHTGIGGYGILGYGHTRAKTYNSMSGAVDKTAVGYHGAITGIVADNADTTDVNEYNNSIIEENTKTSMDGYISNVSGVKSIVDFSTLTQAQAVKTAQANAQKNYNFKYSVMSSAAAGWTVNANYQQQELGNGEHIYYTLDANGDVRFGEESNQIYRIKLICDQDGETCTTHPTRYAYGIAGREITLGFDVEANYYACADENVTIKGNVLTFSEGAEAEENTFTVYADYNADRGNVNSKGDIDILDALDAVRMAVDKTTPVLKTADVNSNHKVDIRDAYQIIRYALSGKNENIVADFVAGEPTEKESDYLKVASYNIKGAYYDPSDENNSTGDPLSRIDEVLAELEAIDADIIGFQEVPVGASVSDGEDVLDLLYTGLNTALGNKYKYMLHVPTRQYTSGGSAGDGIISKYPALDSETIWFKGKSFPDDPTKNLDQSNNRAFTWFKIDVDENEKYEQGGEDIIFYMCHLSTASDAMANAELQYIIQYMKEHHSGDRVVCVGDWNVGAYHTKEVLDNENEPDLSYTTLNGGDNYNTYTRTNPYSGSMIDNILISDNLDYFRFSESRLSGAPGLNTRAQFYDASGDTVGTPYEGKAFTDEAWTASDHMPIWAYIKI